jgi:hypothetical protein
MFAWHAGDFDAWLVLWGLSGEIDEHAGPEVEGWDRDKGFESPLEVRR